MLPSLFISHGAPLLALQPEATGPALRQLADSLPRPELILIVSAHWQSQVLQISSAEQPDTWHDFYGFPQALYKLRYPAPGAPEQASAIAEQLSSAGFPTQLNAQQPRDHGAWVPMLLMYPQADIPVLQLSLPYSATPEWLIGLGNALKGLRSKGVLLIGSGSLTHNLAELDWQAGNDHAADWAVSFCQWMLAQIESNDAAALNDYRRLAPHAVRNHPTDEHLLPLFFAYGAGGTMHPVHQGFSYGALAMDILRFD